MLYNGFLGSHCDCKVKQVVQIETYCKEEMGRNFSAYSSENAPAPCKSCVKCCTKCDCGPNCLKGGLHFNLFDIKEISDHLSDQTSSSRAQTVSDGQRTLLKSGLDCFKDAVKSSICGDFKPVSCSTVSFDNLQVQQLLSHCENIFTFRDIFKFAEIWRHDHAKKIFSIFLELFGDIDITFNEMVLEEKDFEDMEIVHDDWNEMQDNTSSFILVMKIILSTLMEELDETVDQSEMSDVQVGNENELIAPIINKIKL